MNATIFGRISRDAEIRETENGTVVANFGVALNVYKKGENGVTWVNAAIFGKQAESLVDYLTKGSSVALSGDLVLRTYDARDGGSKTTLDMNVNSVALLGAGTQSTNTQHEERKPERRAAQSGNTQKSGGLPTRAHAATSEDFDDALGF